MKVKKVHLVLFKLFIVFWIANFGHLNQVGIIFAKEQPNGQNVIIELKNLLKDKPYLKEALEGAIRRAELTYPKDLNTFYEFLDKYLHAIPEPKEWLSNRMTFYYIINSSSEGVLNKDKDFQQWVHSFVNELGQFLNTYESAKYIGQYISDPNYKLEDYIKPVGGWLTFNQFFFRHIKPGKRLILSPCNDKIIVSPADSVYVKSGVIDEKGKVTIKGLTWSIKELLDGSPYWERFKGGIYYQMYLSPKDYHRFHTTVSGTVKEARIINGKNFLDVYKKEDGTLAVRDGLGYQVEQERGLVIIESPIGYVAMIPVGMGIVSSVNITAEKGVFLKKGDEFGYFAFGGSDIILLFEKKAKVKVLVKEGEHKLQGQKIAISKK